MVVKNFAYLEPQIQYAGIQIRISHVNTFLSQIYPFKHIMALVFQQGIYTNSLQDKHRSTKITRRKNNP